MRVLVVHREFPGPFAHLLLAWARRPGWDVRGLGNHGSPGLSGFDALLRCEWGADVPSAGEPGFQPMQAALAHGEAVAAALRELRQSGFMPDLILADPQAGETLGAKQVFPQARLIHRCGWYCDAEGQAFAYDAEFPLDSEAASQVRDWHALHSLSMAQCDAAISPTRWQRARYPESVQAKILVQHEGIDTLRLMPDPQACVLTAEGALFGAGDPVISFVARDLVPQRGFYVFMRALARVQSQHPGCHALVIGGDGPGLGRPVSEAAHWRDKLLAELPSLDRSRVHFLGRVPQQTAHKLLQVAAVHVHLSYPFGLSTSLLEAMACGACVVAGDVPPVRELVQDGRNGRLVDSLDPQAVADAVLDQLQSPRADWREQALRDVQAYSLRAGLDGYDQVNLSSWMDHDWQDGLQEVEFQQSGHDELLFG